MGNDGVSFSQLKMTNPSVLPILRKTDVSKRRREKNHPKL